VSDGPAPRLGLVVAIARGGVIGHDGGMPWQVPEDLKHFKAVTLGHAIVMGRKTYESIGRPLPRRRNLVVSRNPNLQLPGCEVYGSFSEALAAARETDPMPMIVGGAALYAEALPEATDLFVTELDLDVPGDTFFPSFDRDRFEERERRPGATVGVTFVHLVRR